MAHEVKKSKWIHEKNEHERKVKSSQKYFMIDILLIFSNFFVLIFIFFISFLWIDDLTFQPSCWLFEDIFDTPRLSMEYGSSTKFLSIAAAVNKWLFEIIKGFFYFRDIMWIISILKILCFYDETKYFVAPRWCELLKNSKNRREQRKWEKSLPRKQHKIS